MVRWSWRLARNGAIRFGLMLLLLSLVFQNISWLNFLTGQPIGSALLVLSVIFVLRHIYRTLRWYYVWIKQKRKFNNLIIHFCIYFLVSFIILSIPLNHDDISVALDKSVSNHNKELQQQEMLKKPNMYLVCSNKNTVSVIDTDKNSIVSSINVGKNPWGIVVSPDGKKAYVVNIDDDSVSVIDTVTNTVESTIYVEEYHGMRPAHIVISPDGTKLYISDSSSISVVDVNTKKIVATLGKGELVNGVLCPSLFSPKSIAISPDGNKLYALDAGGSILVIDTSDNTIKTTIGPLGNFPYAPSYISITPNGKQLYITTQFTNKIINTITVIDTSTNCIVDNIDIGSKEIGRIIFNFDGTRAYIAGDSGNVYVFDTIGNKVIATVQTGMDIGEGTGIKAMEITYDGTKLYVITDMLRVIDTSTNRMATSVDSNVVSDISVYVGQGCFNMATMTKTTGIQTIPTLQGIFVIFSLFILYILKRST